MATFNQEGQEVKVQINIDKGGRGGCTSLEPDILVEECPFCEKHAFIEVGGGHGCLACGFTSAKT